MPATNTEPNERYSFNNYHMQRKNLSLCARIRTNQPLARQTCWNWRSTSPVRCSHFTSGNPSHFSTLLLTSLAVFVCVSETWRVYTTVESSCCRTSVRPIFYTAARGKLEHNRQSYCQNQLSHQLQWLHKNLRGTSSAETQYSFFIYNLTETDGNIIQCKSGFPTRFLLKPKNRFLAACKPGSSVLNFYLQCLITRPY